MAILEASAYDISESKVNPFKTTDRFPTVSIEEKSGNQTLTAEGTIHLIYQK